ncbi:MAG: ABC transporter permease [Rhodospirillaceae bacterium]|nr:ABC transporter permease [Rhodospirillaceae bacterium]MBL6933458.1 ABC transporter permease [Rhodospirillales bacterium]
MAALVFSLLALLLPLASGETTLAWADRSTSLIIVLGFAIVGGLVAWRGVRGLISALAILFLVYLATLMTMQLLDNGVAGSSSWGFWSFILALWALTWRGIASVAAYQTLNKNHQRLVAFFVPACFGFWLLFLWEMVCQGFGVPGVLLPPPSAIFIKLIASLDILWADFVQTFMKAVISGFAMGCASGFIIAILVDRVPFLKRGLLPLGNLVSALPIVGVAPIMVMWFGFDWQSKAAVVVIMTFFPMLVNTVTGLSAAGALELELMRSYGAGYWQTLFKLRLPAAMPFVFNALKINSTLALIGAIVAEFFGTPIVGMGFRISTEVGRMNVDMVWAEIFIAALAGSAFYGVMALMERTVTFWHPSYRTKN